VSAGASTAAIAPAAPAAPRTAGTWRAAAAIGARELRGEWRSRHSIGSSLVLTVAVVAILSFAVGPAAGRAELAAPLLWIVLLFAATAGLGHAFAREVDSGTWDLLRQNAAPGAVLLGKWAAALAILAVLEAVVLGGGALLVGPRVGSPAAFAAVLLLGTLNLAVALPLVSALLAQARRHGGLAAVLAFPLLVPGLFAAVAGTRRALEGTWPLDELRALFGFAAALAIAGWRLFAYVWDE
jgi:heme exporter protein B